EKIAAGCCSVDLEAVRIELFGNLKLGTGLLVLPPLTKLISQVCSVNGGSGIELLRLRVLCKGLVVLPHLLQIQSVPIMSRRIVWVEFNRPFQLFLRGEPIPFLQFEKSQRSVGFGQLIVDGERLHRRRFRLGETFFSGQIRYWEQLI